MKKTMSFKELAARLVGFNTVSSESPVEMADFICGYLEGCGFKIERYPYLTTIPKVERVPERVVEKINIIARKGGEESKFVYSGHMDTVPFGPGWNSDPLSLVERNYPKVGQVFQGLGIADMKIFLAIAMKAGEAISATELKQPFALCFTSDEEVGCVGVRKLRDAVKAKNRIIGKYIVIGEPTESLPVYSHKGYVYLEVTVGAYKNERGNSGDKDNPCHSSNPFTTTNVIEKALCPVIDELCKFRMNLEMVHDSSFSPPFATMNIGGEIKVGRMVEREIEPSNEEKRKGLGKKYEYIPDKIAKSIIPRGFRIYGDIRPLPGQNPNDLVKILKSNIQERVDRIKTTNSNEKFEISVGCPQGIAVSHPMVTPKNSLLLEAIEELSGNQPATAAYNTEGGIFNRAGSETVIWGPSDILQAHKDNEYVLAQLFEEETIEKYLRLIKRICIERSD